MAKQSVNLGTSANKGDGDPLRTAFDKVNDNFTEVYSLLGAEGGDVDDVVAPMLVHSDHTNVSVTRDDAANKIIFSVDPYDGDITGSVFGDDSTVLVDGVNNIIPKANIEDSANWDTAFGWGNHTAGGYAPQTTTYTKTEVDSAISAVNTLDGDFTGSVFGDDSTVLVDGINNKIVGPIESTSILPGDVSTDIGSSSNRFYNAWFTGQIETDSINAAILYGPLTGDVTGNVSGTAGAVAFSGITSKPTTLAGYGITDAQVAGAPYDGDITGSVFGDDSTVLVDGVNNKIVGAVDTASLRTSEDNIALGNSAGFTNQGAYGIALGFGAGQTTQGYLSVAIGYTAGQTSQGESAVAIGRNAGQATQGADATAVGYSAGQSDQGADATAVGSRAGATSQGAEAVAIGNASGYNTQGASAVAIGVEAGLTTQGTSGIAIGNSSGSNTQGNFAVAIGVNAGTTSQGISALAVGENAGRTTQGAKSVAIGLDAGKTTQGTSAVAIGENAGAGAITTATYVSGGVASTVMVVDDTTDIVVGMRVTGTGFIGSLEQQRRVVSVDDATTVTLSSVANDGTPSGTITFKSAQDYYAVAIGSGAGQTSQGPGCVAIGYLAGKVNQDQGTAIGSRAGEITQGLGAVAVGVDTGRNNQGTHSVAVGKWAGKDNQGQEGIAIGYFAGYTSQGEDSIAIGKEAGKTNQAARSIILNATDSALDTTQTDSLIIKPIRSAAMTTILGYDAGTGEVTHNAAIPGYISLADLKTEVAASADFAAFKGRIAAL